MKVVILCGGQGTRLREETEYRPKPLVEIGNRPILWHIMKIYATHGHKQFVLCLGYRGAKIKEYFLNYEAMNNDFTISLGRRDTLQVHGAHVDGDLSVTLAETGNDTMTGGRILRIRKYVENEPYFLCSYGDGVADVNINDVIQYHRQHGKIATLTAVRPISRFGLLDIKQEGEVNDFSEKPQMDNWVNAGYFVFSPKIFDYIRGDESILENETMQRLVQEGQLMAYRHSGFFFAMDTYREYLAINKIWDSGSAPWKIWNE